MENSISRLPQSNWQEYLRWCLQQRQRFRVVEQSMLPLLKPGTTVFATCQPPSHVEAGDIVIARHPFKTDLSLIKRVQTTFYDGGCYLISDNATDPTAQDSRSLGVFSSDLILARVTSILP